MFVFRLFGVSWVMPKQVVDLLACWNRGVGRCWAAGEQFHNASCGLYEKGVLELSRGRSNPAVN